MTSINDIRTAADRLYGENKWSLAESYCHLVGLSNRSPASSRKVYSLDNGNNWHLAASLVALLTSAADRLGR